LSSAVNDDSREPVEVEEAPAKKTYPFTPARLFAYTRCLEARIEELEQELALKDAYVTHLANMGLAMRGIPPPQQKRRQSPTVQTRPRTIAQINKANKEKFEARRQNETSSSKRAEESAKDQRDVQEQINAVVMARTPG
jgi:hypothetical protein